VLLFLILILLNGVRVVFVRLESTVHSHVSLYSNYISKQLEYCDDTTGTISRSLKLELMEVRER